MSISVVQISALTTSGSDTTVECTFGSNTTAGNLIWMAFRLGAVRTFSSVTDTVGGNTYAQGTAFFTSTVSHGSVYGVLTNGGFTTWTVNIGGGNSGGSGSYCIELSSTTGWPATASALDATATPGTTGSATSVSTGTLTTSTAVTAILTFQGLGNPRDVTPDTGFTEFVDNTNVHQAQYLLTSSVFNETVDVTWTTATSAGILADAFVPVAAGGGARNRAIVIS